MSDEDFNRQQYLTLCEEIRASKSRIFWLLILGIAVVVVSGYLAAEHPLAFTNAATPFLLIALMLSYVAEQNNIARAGRYVREVIEPRHASSLGWERWLESKQTLREVDHCFVMGFSVLFLVFFAVATSLTLRNLDKYQKSWYVLAAGAAYTLGAALVAYVLWRHWRAAGATEASA
jgi:hypothetical protein